MQLGSHLNALQYGFSFRKQLPEAADLTWQALERLLGLKNKYFGSHSRAS